MKQIKLYLSDFYSTRNIASLTDIVVQEPDQKKFKFDFNSDTDDELLEVDLKKEISSYIKYKTSDSNILDFCKNSKKRFQALFCIAKMILTTTAISVPSESSFSDGLICQTIPEIE